MSVILGLNGYPDSAHDPGAALVIDGVIVAAVEEERLNRVKRAFGHIPVRSIAEVLSIAGLQVSDVDSIAYPWDPALASADAGVIQRVVQGWLGPGPQPSVHFVPHHEAHAFCGLSYVPGGFAGKRIAVIVTDGSGESSSGAIYMWDGARLNARWLVPVPSSLGIYYEALTRVVGFGWGEEGKTMGLAAYGRPSGVSVPRPPEALIAGPPRPRDRSYNAHAKALEERVAEFRRLAGPVTTFNQRADVAFAGQAAAGNALQGLLKAADSDVTELVMSGGFALNCSVNAEIAELLAERDVRLTVPPPANDAGVALGAAVAIALAEGSAIWQSSAYLGRTAEPDAAVAALEKLGARVVRATPDDVADRLVDGKAVFGWFMGRAEIGPRALGRRAILARADNTAVRERVNFLKGRESWRPLAPSLTPRQAAASLSGKGSPYMLQSTTILESAAAELAGVMHVDGSTRPQVVEEQDAFTDLLLEAGRRVGCEALICTSFNRANEPIVYTAEDAYASALKMRLDGIAGDGWLAEI